MNKYDNPAQAKSAKGLLLKVTHGDNAGQEYYLNDIIGGKPCGLVTIGRKDAITKNDIMLTESHSSFISRRHCTLELDDCCDPDHWVIRDGQFDTATRRWSPSTNGTYVNSKKAGEGGLAIAPGDIIAVGDVKMRVEAY